MIQLAPLDAVHAHVELDAATLTVPLPPVASKAWLSGEIEKVHGGGGGAAGCVTVTPTPAIESEPLRSAPPLAAAEKVVVPEPVPDAPPVIVIHAAPLDAVHVQVDADAETAKLPVPPPVATDCDEGDTLKVHGGGGGGGAPGCVTVTVAPAIVSDPLRSPPPLAAAENVVAPAPVPDAPPVIVIHGAPLDAVHVQVGAEGVTVKLPVPPPVATDCVGGETLNVHGGGGGGGGAAAWFIVNV